MGNTINTSIYWSERALSISGCSIGRMGTPAYSAGCSQYLRGPTSSGSMLSITAGMVRVCVLSCFTRLIAHVILERTFAWSWSANTPGVGDTMTNAALRITRPRPHSMGHREVQQSRRWSWSAGLPTPITSVVAARKTVKQSGCACRALGAPEPGF